MMISAMESSLFTLLKVCSEGRGGGFDKEYNRLCSCKNDEKWINPYF